jgi:pyruvate,water dikinase
MKIYDLGEIPAEVIETVGGKAKGLCELIKNGFNVPTGFVLVGVKNEKDTDKAYQYLKEKGLKNVAVRSSATAEDGEDF